MEQIPKNERPRERMLRHGAEALSLIELIAILLGSGIKGKTVFSLAEELVERFGGAHELLITPIHELMKVEGLGQSKAIQIKAAFEMAFRAQSKEAIEPMRISYPETAVALFKPHFEGKTVEELYILFRNTKGRFIGIEKIRQGSISEILVQPRDIFLRAIAKNAYSFILAHNHPSGDPTPSRADIEMTRRLEISGRIMGIPIDDHLIIGGYRAFCSLYTLEVLLQRDRY